MNVINKLQLIRKVTCYEVCLRKWLFPYRKLK